MTGGFGVCALQGRGGQYREAAFARLLAQVQECALVLHHALPVGRHPVGAGPVAQHTVDVHESGGVLGGALRLCCDLLLDLFVLQTQHVVLNFFGVGRGAEDFQRVVLQCLDPRSDVGSMLLRVVANAQLVAENHAGDFGAQLFFGISFTAERMHHVALEPRCVSGPVSQLVQRSRVVIVGACEAALVRQVNAVGCRPVEGAVVLTVADHGAGCLQDLLGPLDCVPILFLTWRGRRQSVDLLGIEHSGEEHSGPLQPDRLRDRLALGVEDRLAGCIGLGLVLGEFPVLDRRACLAFAHLRIDRRCLLVGHPALILVPLAHQLQGIDTLVALTGRRVDRHVGAGFARLPRLLPRRGAFLQLLDQFFRNGYVERFFIAVHCAYLLVGSGDGRYKVSGADTIAKCG